MSHRDLLSHLTTTSTSSDDIAHALLALNLRTIPFCSSTLTAALHRLAECDEGTVKTMRREIEAATYSEGWTTHSLAQMTKIDSFLKETMRLDGLNAITMQRITVAPYTFLDGTRIPEGTQLGVACSPVHLDASKYPSPNIFDPFRFVSGVGPRYNLTTASPDFLAWGLGYGACPGRFFAGAVMKLLLAHLVLLYDVRCEEGTEGKLPKIKWIGVHGAPYLKSSVLLRKRL
ncbi:hypothetical protein H0H93_014161 [Arthromyces matolae]|nr:hypothetical protein H0H93_014161 [Arthromyces matolae]